MDSTTVAARADALWSRGNRAEALALLRAHMRAEPTDRRVRLQLAEYYRSISAPDQAGRWGLALPAWTTAVERDRAARLIAGARVHEDDLARFLVLPEGEWPDEVVELFPDIERYRSRFEAAFRRHLESAQEADRAEDIAEALVATTVVVLVVGAGVSWVTALVDGPAVAAARWTAVATALAGVVSATAKGLVAAGGGHLRRAVLWGAVAFVLVVAAVISGVAAVHSAVS